jgi:membrane-associated phospholipid phosphatase
VSDQALPEEAFSKIAGSIGSRAVALGSIGWIRTRNAVRRYKSVIIYGPMMAVKTVRPTKADVSIANAVARHTNGRAEAIARGLTWGADEKILLTLAVVGWLASLRGDEATRRTGNHALLVTVAVSLLPHGLKAVFDQTRPDRKTVVGHLHGISLSGKREDAFPSGHALHMGALASAAGTLPPWPRRLVRSFAVGLSLTRIFVLAHWASDVVFGFAVGAVVERLVRFWTGYPSSRSENEHANP